MTPPSKRLAELGIQLPAVARPVASYVPAVRTGNLILTSGQLPFADGKLVATGRVPDVTSPKKAVELARVCCLNALAAAAELAGGIDHITRVIRVVVYLYSTAEFGGQPGVANGASELLEAIFGEAGKHARSAIGVAALPLEAPVELELTVEVAG